MVGPDDLTNAVGLNSATFNTARIVGPALAGLLIGALGGGAWATGWVILINAVVVRRGDLAARAHGHRAAPLAATARPARPGMLLEGVRYVRSQPKMMVILVMVFFAGTFGMNFQITSALMATQVFGKGASEFGILGSAMAVGSLTGALLAARRTEIRLRLVAGAAVGFGVAEIVAGLMPTYVAFALMCPVIGVCTLTMLNSANATMQLESEPALRGRVMALYMTIVMGGTPIGSPIIGWVGQQFGPRWTLLGGGTLVIVGVVLAVALLAAAQPRRGGRSRTPARWTLKRPDLRFCGRISFWCLRRIASSLESRVRPVRAAPRALVAMSEQSEDTPSPPGTQHHATSSCPARRRIQR